MTVIRLSTRCVLVLLALAAACAQAQDLRRAFVTSTAGNGNLSTWADAGGQAGLAAADAICQARGRRRNGQP